MALQHQDKGRPEAPHEEGGERRNRIKAPKAQLEELLCEGAWSVLRLQLRRSKQQADDGL